MNEAIELRPEPPVAPAPSAIQLLQVALSGGVTKENVEVAKELIAMHRDEQARQNKVSFNQNFFALRKEIGRLDIYADGAATTKAGKVAYRYCTEKEISEKLDPVLFRHGFAMMFGQRQDGERSVAIITLVHESGHEETREYAVRSGRTNEMKDDTAADTGATTSAWRHLCIKFFGLKSRIREDADERNEGDPKACITPVEAEEFHHRAQMINANIPALLLFASPDKANPITKFTEIPVRKYSEIDSFLKRKEAVK